MNYARKVSSATKAQDKYNVPESTIRTWLDRDYHEATGVIASSVGRPGILTGIVCFANKWNHVLSADSEELWVVGQIKEFRSRAVAVTPKLVKRLALKRMVMTRGEQVQLFPSQTFFTDCFTFRPRAAWARAGLTPS